ncbi:MAG TPA: amino acid adenylation domain-containing protein [Polyangiaceae bacterium]|nr:amino acid adenylation domain-containing protein [Polyangiaceae bacterium]
MSGEREKRWALFEQKLRERGLAKDVIPKLARTDSRLPASFAQERLLFLEQLNPGSAAYNDHYALRVGGRLDVALLGRVLDEIARRHETLRTTFVVGAQGEAEQRIHDQMPIPLRHDSWEPQNGTFEAWVVAEGVREARRPFDLANGPLSRSRLLSHGNEEHVLLFTIHHAIWDGWSSGVFAHELSTLYRALAAGRPPALPDLETQYADYADWQRRRLTGQVLDQKVEFWKTELEGAPATIDIPTDRPRPRMQTFTGRTLYASLSKELSAKLDAHVRVLGRTPFALLFACYAVLLSRYSGQRDLVIATPSANRGRVELEGLIGCFVNTLAIRVDLSGDPTLASLVTQVSDRLLRAQPHQDLPFEKLLEALQVERDLSRSPVAQIMFVLQNTPPRMLELGGLELSALDVDAGFAKLDLTLNVLSTNDVYSMAWEYNADLFDESSVLRMMQHYQHLLAQLLAAPDAGVFGVELLQADERRRVLYEWNDTAAVYPNEATLHSLFEQQVQASAESVALIVGQQRLSYAQLAARARGIAQALRQRGVGPGDLVGVFLEREQRLIASLLGVMMSGAAYVPLDPKYPLERLQLILEDAKAPVVLTERKLIPLLPEPLASRALDVDRAIPLEQLDQVGAGSGDRAYIIYTSGSTGKPKGVEIQHRSAVAFISWAHSVFEREQWRGVLAATSVCFDLSIFEIFGPLLAGGSVILADNALSLPELPARCEVTLVNTVPSAAAELLRSGAIPSSVRTVNLAGEPLPEETVLELYGLPHVERVYNLYGPSETTTYSTYALTTRGAWQPTIGRPISNTRAYVLDEQLRPVPVGVRGELFIGGLGVALGYLDRPELTAQRFLPDPFCDGSSARMYRTGDVVRWRDSSELEYFGRNDQQVKLRGFRIELGEVENALRRQTGVIDAVALVREDKPGVKALVGYVVGALGETLSSERLRAALSEALPDYMVPAKLVVLDRLPLSPNGKVDRKRLPAPPERREDQVFVAPQSQVETMLARIWQEVLGLQRVGVQDNFFELGGDSIAAMRMSALARRAGLELTVSQLFQSLTLGALGERVTLARQLEAKPLPSEPFELSPIQHWFFERKLVHPHHYNQSVLVELEPAVDLETLRLAIEWAISRHSALRLQLEPRQAGFVQRFGPVPRVAVRIVGVSEQAADAGLTGLQGLTHELEGTLNFERGPLGHAVLFDAPSRGLKALFLVLHHLVVDVVSWHVLLGDIAGAYRHSWAGLGQLAVGPATTHYAEYVERIAGYATSRAGLAGAELWASAELSVPPLPRDFGDARNLTASRDTISWTLDAERTSTALQRARRAYNIGIEDVALTALCLALCDWMESSRVVVDVEKHGRELPGLDLSDCVGWFTAIFPLIFQAPSGRRSALLEIKEALHAAPDRGLSFLAHRYGPDSPLKQRLAQMPAREVVYNFVGNVSQALDAASPFSRVEASSAASNHHPQNQRAHLLEVTARVEAGALDVQLTFSRKVHARSTIARLMKRFGDAFDALLSHLQREGVGGFTPSDFPLAHLAQSELDARHDAWWTKVEDVYALTPAQHAILVDVLRDPHAGYYVPQLYAIVGTLDGDLLEQSLRSVLARHSALRTALVYSGVEQPVQAVFATVNCPLLHDDWRADGEAERRQRLESFMAHDRKRGFALDQAPLLRLFRARWTEAQDVLVWTIHHVISDGWSLPIIIAEVLQVYAALSEQQPVKLRPAPPFRDYVAWLLRQDQARGEAHFREVLQGASALDIGIAEDPSYRKVIETRLELDAATSRALEQLAKQHSVTLGVVIQAAWAVVLARYAERSDVTFGSVDAGRPDDLERVSEMVGMFVTTLPLRVNVDDAKPVAELLADVQAASAAIREHAYVALARVASAAGSAQLLQSICVIENYPSLVEGADARLRLQELGSAETTRFPLTVSATTRDTVKLAVSASLVDPGAGAELLEGWRHALEQMASDIVRVVGEIDLPLPTRRRRNARYWKAELEGVPATLLPADRPRLGVASEPLRASLELAISEPLAATATALAQGSETQPALVLLGAFMLLTSRYAAQAEVVVAVEVAAGRYVPLRVVFSDTLRFSSLVRQLDRQARASAAHFDEVLLERFADRTPVAFSLLEPDGEPSAASRFELELSARPIGGGFVVAFSYDPRLFEETSVARMSRHYRGFLEALLRRPELLLRQVPFGDAVGPVGEPGVSLAGDATLLGLFEAQIKQAPEAIALLSAGTQLTYTELDARSSAAAARLKSLGVGSGQVVALRLRRSATLVVMLLAIVKAGAAFAAIDTATPELRVRFILEDCNARVCLVEPGQALQLVSTQFIEADSLMSAEPGPSHRCEVVRSDLAYVIYTSGSTGVPKGVMVEHASLLNYLQFYGRVTNIGPGDRLLQFASPSFDVSVEEIFGALCHGATLVLRSDDVTPRALLAACEALGLTLLSLPTAYWNEITRSLVAGGELPRQLRVVVIGGERASGEVLTQWRRHVSDVRLLNMYGPTEATISATYADLTLDSGEAGDPPIGRPVPGAIALVVDDSGNPVPIGVPGELLLGGSCLARGYLNRPGLTAEKFTPSPLLPGRVYHTGDLVRWRSDEQLEYLGRIDQQIKIRGFRVELGEIEALLRAQPGVEDVVVVLRDEHSDNPRIVAYVVGAAKPQQLRHALAGLPSYMVPAAFATLDRLPITRSGKIDRRALPAPQAAGDKAHYVAPSSPLEASLVDIWQRVLHIEGLSTDANFFELGGHSLLATQVISRIQAELALEVSVRDLFEAPTVARLAERLRGRGTSQQRPQLVPRQQQVAALSFAQARLWFLDQLEPGSAASNMPVALRVVGKLDVPSLARALDQLVRRHSILRTVFISDANGQPLQKAEDACRVPLQERAAPAGFDAEAWALEQALIEARRPFDLAKGPLFRASLLALGSESFVLLLSLHHIVSDGWSIGILVRELSLLYRAFERGSPVTLPELPIQYADYSVWQREQLSGPELERQLRFWKSELEGAPLRLELPLKPRVRSHSYAAKTIHALLEPPLAEAIDELARSLGATPFLVLLAAWATLLSRVSGQADLVIGTPVANRRQLETEGMVGLFVNTLAIRADLRHDPSFHALVTELRERLLRAQAHEDLPFEKLVDALHIERNMQSTPIFQVMFAMQNTPELELAGLEISNVHTSTDVAKFDLTLNVERTAAGYATSWEYRTDYFEAAFIERAIGQFQRLLAAVVEAPQQPSSQVALLTDAERRTLLIDLNRTEGAYPDALTFELIEAQARRTPLAMAVKDEGTELSYAELSQRSDALARRLLPRLRGPEARVGLAVSRSVELVIALLGIQKAGAAYIPLDPALPISRLREILEDSGAELALTESALFGRLREASSIEMLCLDQGWSAPFDASSALPRHAPESLAYVLFTSGSTGQPKGVEISHRALVNFLWSMQREPGIASTDVVLAATNLSFDIAGLELYLPLICGASVYIAGRDVSSDSQLLAQTLAAQRVTFFQATPSSYKLLLAGGFRGSEGLKLLVGGEQLPLDQARRLLGCCGSLWNVYGPTETTIWSTCQRITSDELARRGVTIGRPIANTQVYVLDGNLQPVPVGVAGELYLGGHGLARGYAGRPDLTAERFVPNPFGPGRLYRTGDVARYLEGGVLECLGRVDHQVKVRGYRIELGDIEAAIRRHPDVNDAAVGVQVEGDDKRLVAYVVSPASITSEALRSFLKDALPDYMVPAHYVALDRLPTTPNGKLDRKALPDPGLGPRATHVPPRDETEQRVAGLFESLLRVAPVGAFDHFFDLGGHSLLGTELVFRLRRDLGVDLPVRVLFEAPTVAALAAVVRAPVTYSGTRLPKQVVLARQGSGVPWFCFPALAGTAAPYLASVVKDAGPSVYLLEAPGLEGDRALTKVDALAGVFADAIRALAPTGPVRLLGWSFGAMTAFAAARRLAAEGCSIDELVLVDPALPGSVLPEGERELAAAFIADVAESVGKLGALLPLWQQVRSELQDRTPADLFHAAQVLGIFPVSTRARDFENRLSVYTAGARALRDFTLVEGQVYAGRSSVVAASRGNGQHTGLWQRHLSQSRFALIDATHYTILEHLEQLLR